MSDDKKRAEIERKIFREFAERSGLRIDPESIESRKPDEPDILCSVIGEGCVAFELKSLTASEIMRVVDHQVRTNPAESVSVMTEDPTDDIVKQTREKMRKGNYKSRYDMELLLYTGATVTPSDIIIDKIRFYFENDTFGFRRIWFMGFAGEPCECVVEAQ